MNAMGIANNHRDNKQRRWQTFNLDKNQLEMSSTPSRSEIETALSGRTKRQEGPKKRPQRAPFDLEVPPRRQQVIGGDLTGIASRPRRGIFSRYSDISLSLWVAGAVVLLILLAFFWPQSGDSTREVTQAQAQTQSELISSIEPIKEGDDSSSALGSFTRDSDLDRAKEFRELDEKNQEITTLLTQAEGLIAKGQYTQPEGNNAVQSYKTILTIDNANVRAKQGLREIKDRYLEAGTSALEGDNIKGATNALARLASIEASSEEHQELETAIENWKTGQQINDLLSKAGKAINQDRLILPANASALFYYREALKLDDENKTVKKGIKRVADTYVKRANKAIAAGEYQTAAAHLATVSAIDPNHSSISEIEDLMSKPQPPAEQVESADAAQVVKETDSAASEPQSAAVDTSTDTQRVIPADKDARNQTGPEPDATVDSSSVEAEQTATRAEPSEVPGDSVVTPNVKRTPSRQSSEQADFDRQYLKQGLEAYYKGEYETAAALLQPLADKGVARAQFRLAYMHYLGRGFDRDRQEADRRIRAALPAIRKFADEGRAWAQSDIGSLYEDGLVLPRDFGEAVYWYRSAAEQGYPGAQTNLGLMYARGRGVSSSRRTAIQWFQRAAKQGDNVAKRNLKALGIN